MGLVLKDMPFFKTVFEEPASGKSRFDILWLGFFILCYFASFVSGAKRLLSAVDQDVSHRIEPWKVKKRVPNI
jgi:hypothetical protein